MTIISTFESLVTGARWYIVLFAVAAYGLRLYRQYSRLKAFDGPWTTGWSSFWLVRAVVGQNTHIDLAKVCEKYGTHQAWGVEKIVDRLGWNVIRRLC